MTNLLLCYLALQQGAASLPPPALVPARGIEHLVDDERVFLDRLAGRIASGSYHLHFSAHIVEGGVLKHIGLAIDKGLDALGLGTVRLEYARDSSAAKVDFSIWPLYDIRSSYADSVCIDAVEGGDEVSSSGVSTSIAYQAHRILSAGDSLFRDGSEVIPARYGSRMIRLPVFRRPDTSDGLVVLAANTAPFSSDPSLPQQAVGVFYRQAGVLVPLQVSLEANGDRYVVRLDVEGSLR